MWHYWGTSGDFVGNYLGIRMEVVRTRVALDQKGSKHPRAPTLRRFPFRTPNRFPPWFGLVVRNSWGIRVEVVRSRVALLENYWGLRGK